MVMHIVRGQLSRAVPNDFVFPFQLKSSKYRANVASKAAYEANRPSGATYNMDPTDEIFANEKETEEEKKAKQSTGRVAPPKRKKKLKRAAAAI